MKTKPTSEDEYPELRAEITKLKEYVMQRVGECAVTEQRLATRIAFLEEVLKPFADAYPKLPKPLAHVKLAHLKRAHEVMQKQAPSA